MANWKFVRPNTRIEAIIEGCGPNPEQRIFPIVASSDDIYQGYITINEINNCATETAGDLLIFLGEGHERRNTFVYDSEPLEKAKRKLRETNLQILPVVDAARHYRGTIDKDSSS